MPHKASDKPWIQGATGWWCATVDGKRVYLAKDYRLACRKLKILLTRKRQESGFEREWLDAPFSELADLFLEKIKDRRKPATYTAYRYDLLRALCVLGTKVRVGNPMITGVFCILFGEAVFFGSLLLLGWFGLFVAVNMTVIPLWEVPGLVKRFGDDYLLYKRNVPRWIPRLTAWEQPPITEM